MDNKLTWSLFSLLLALMLITAIISMPSSIFTQKDVTKQEAEASGPNDFRFTAVGDWGCTSATGAMTSMMSTRNPEVVIGLGDYSYQTTILCWHDILASYPIVHNALHLHNSTAFGNHETTCGTLQCLSSAGKAEYLAHFNQPPTYYSFDHKRVHFIVLDTNLASGIGSNQYNFISSDLIQAKQLKDGGFVDWIVVSMHHPMYTSCNDGGSSSTCDSNHGNMTAIRGIYQPLFDQNSVDVVLQAHVHAYERMAPLKSGAKITHPDTFDYTNPIGQIYLTVGTGGKDHYHYTSHPAMSLKQIEDIDGFLQVDVTESTFVGRFVDTAGIERDTFIITKSPDSLPAPGPPPPPPPVKSPPSPSYYFTGSNKTDIANSNSLQLTQFSAATWFKLDKDYSTATVKSLIVNKGGFGSEVPGKNMNYGIWVDFGSTNGNKIEAGFETAAGPDNFVRSSAKYNDGNWHYAVVTFNGSTLILYIDGAQVAAKMTTAIPDNTGTQPLRIGMNSQASDRGYKGYADEIRVWNRAVSPQEEADQFNLGTFNTNGQVAYLTP